ncbi:MAG TPA: TonB family protein, partial [Candidatus Krumholzibacteria bacterium]
SRPGVDRAFPGSLSLEGARRAPPAFPRRHTMDLQERDALYHRRLAIISTIVVIAMAASLVAGQRYLRSVNPVMVGWQGEMELLPELTIEPEMITAEPSPAEQPQPKKQAIVIPAIDRPTELEVARTPDTPADEDFQPAIDARGVALSEKAPMSRPVSYSQTYVILRTVKPKYPDHERDNGIEGNVTVELLVDEQGMVAQANALGLVGPMSFQDAALDAVRQFVFQPPIVDGEPSTMWIKFVIKFRLNS